MHIDFYNGKTIPKNEKKYEPQVLCMSSEKVPTPMVLSN